jgi:anti-sigma factor ChrR (cupin superfamily)
LTKAIMETLVNADFTRRVVIATDREPWIASPQPGVERRLLDRIGGEVARATSLVRYVPDSRFPPHDHPLGEEFLVLDGVFSDEHGDYPAGTYVRNPPGSRHAPRTAGGCTIFVKLRQMPPEERARVVIGTGSAAWTGGDHQAPARCLLYAGGGEVVALERLESGARQAEQPLPSGAEILVLAGDLADDHGTYGAGTWIRLPPGDRGMLRSRGGALYWVKRGHLPPT